MNEGRDPFGLRGGPASAVLADGEAQELIGLIYRQSGIVLNHGKKSLISSRLHKRLKALRLGSYRAYLDYLQGSPQSEAELVAMIDEITTNKTEFFRERQHFDLLVSSVLPALARSDWSIVNFWCAGCSTGEEPYSLAMVLAEYFGSTRNFSILATDICTGALRTARQAVYADELGASIPLGLRRKYTLNGRGSQAGRFRIVPELRERVRFDYVNLVADHWDVPGACDVVFCRNVMIYFDAKTRAAIVTKFRRTLKPGGTLFVGHSETLGGIDRRLGFAQIKPTVYSLRD